MPTAWGLSEEMGQEARIIVCYISEAFFTKMLENLSVVPDKAIPKRL